MDREFVFLERQVKKMMYPTDDIYITLAIAKNLIQHGIWGIGDVFVSASSSPIWVVWCAIWGGTHYTPLVTNLIIAMCIWAFMYKVKGMFFASFVLLTALLFGTMTTSVFVGMEHVAHAFLMMIFIHYCIKGESKWIYILAFLVGGIRYESFVCIVILAIYRKDWKIVAYGAIAPLVLGVVSLINGSHFLPNPIMIKSGLDFSMAYFRLDAILVCLALLFGSKDKYVRTYLWILAIIVVVAMVTSHPSSFDRYTTYIHLSVFYIVSMAFWNRRILSIVSLVLLLALPIERQILSCQNILNIKPASKNIHDQQYQMAMFLSDNYSNRPIALNDIGCVSYFSNIDIVDLVGLGGDRIELSDVVADIAIIYPDWFKAKIPDTWTPYGAWEIQNNVVCSRSQVVFFAINESVDVAIEKLRSFKLPEDIGCLVLQQ